MPVSYDFKNSSRNLPRRRNSGSKGLRFFGVLVIVAAITVALVWIFIPHGEDKPKEGTAPANTEAKNETASDTNDSNSSNDNNGGDSSSSSSSAAGSGSSGNSGNSGSGGGTSTSGNESSSSTSTRETSSGSSGTSGTSNETTLESWYKKGSTVPGGDAGDTPVYKPNQAPGADEVIARLKTLSSPDEVISAASAFLMKEYSSGGCCSANWNQVGAYLTAAVQTKFANRNWKHGSITYKVVAGDNFSKIAHRYSTTIEGLKKINRKKNYSLRIGERLTVIPGKWRITISKQSHTLNLWHQKKNVWQIFAVFPIGIGRKNSTPTGKFYIAHRLYHPKWHGPDGRIFAYGDKENPLGECFLKLWGHTGRGPGSGKGYGIHGSPDDNSVGKAISRGCIRMRNQDIILLYYLVPVRTPVEITD